MIGKPFSTFARQPTCSASHQFGHSSKASTNFVTRQTPRPLTQSIMSGIASTSTGLPAGSATAATGGNAATGGRKARGRLQLSLRHADAIADLLVSHYALLAAVSAPAVMPLFNNLEIHTCNLIKRTIHTNQPAMRQSAWTQPVYLLLWPHSRRPLSYTRPRTRRRRARLIELQWIRRSIERARGVRDCVGPDTKQEVLR